MNLHQLYSMKEVLSNDQEEDKSDRANEFNVF